MEENRYVDCISLKDKIYRKLWWIVAIFLFCPATSKFFNFWRIFLLKLFGAKIGKGSVVYSSSKVLSPWNLEIGDFSVIGPNVELHIDKTIIGSYVTVSQGAYLCSGSHDIRYLNKPFISSPIHINDYAWIAAEAFVGPGVTVHEGAVVGARAVVMKDVPAWKVAGGNPAKIIKDRVIC